MVLVGAKATQSLWGILSVAAFCRACRRLVLSHASRRHLLLILPRLRRLCCCRSVLVRGMRLRQQGCAIGKSV